MMNDRRPRARSTPADQVALIAGATEALNSGGRLLLVDLPSGAVARVQCRPSWIDRSSAGGVLQRAAGPGRPQVRPSRRSVPTPGASPTRPSGPACCGRSAARPSTGTSAAASGWCWRASRAAARPPWPGPPTRCAPRPRTSGCSTPRTTGRAGSPTSPRSWTTGGGGTLVLTHLDQLCTEGRQALADALEPHRESTDHERPWVVATVGPGGLPVGEDGIDLLEFFPRTVEVPPLRHHVEDVGRARAAPDRPADPGLRAHLLAGGAAGADAQPLAGQRRAALPGAAQDGGPAPGRRARRPTTCRRRPAPSPAGCSRRWRRSSATRSSTR